MTKFLHFNIPVPSDAKNSLKKRFQSRTVAAEPLDSNTVQALAQTFLSTPGPTVCYLNVGITFLSLKDRYCKAEGRKESTARMAKTTLNVVGVNVTETAIFVHLAPIKGVSLALRANRQSGFATVVGQMTGE